MGISYGLDSRDLDGSSAAKAAPSAKSIKLYYPASVDGVYWINLPTVGPTQVYCLMNSAYDGGGWMLSMKATRGTTFQYTSTHWTTVTTLNPTDTTLNDGDAKYNTMNYYPAQDIMARFPDVTAGGTLGSGLGGWIWNINGFYSNARTTLVNFFATLPETYLLQDNDVTNWQGFVNGPFSGQAGWRKYGFNLNDGARQSRWGFLWNNEITPGSNDVDGGIGMGSRPLYSAGDYVTCCATYLGVNRSMRVEIWVR